jgi:hypothetical protein
VAGRLDRALRNFGETFALFAAVVLVAHVTDTHDALTEWGRRLYFWGRVAYVLLYAAGVPADPFAGVERRHDRASRGDRLPAIWLSMYVMRGGERRSYLIRTTENTSFSRPS